MSNETAKNKLINSMKLTKAGTATTNTATEKKEEPVAQASKPAKKTTKPTSKAAESASFSSRCRVWPD